MNSTANNFITKYLQPGFIFSNLFVPTALVVFYCGVYTLFLFELFPLNVNYYFSLDLFIDALLILLVLLVLLVAPRLLKKQKAVQHPPARSKVPHASSWILLLPLAPVIRYLLSNQETLSLLDAAIILAACLAFSFVFIIAIPALLSRYSPARMLVSVGSAFVFTILNMASISGLLHWLEKGNFAIQLPLFVLALALTWLLLGLENKKDLVFVVLAFFLGSVALQFLPQSKSPAAEQAPSVHQENRLADLIAGRQPVRASNIYLLVYDAYVPNETMLDYGIDNSAQEGFLAGQGFTLYPHAYSVGAHSLSSMNKVFNVGSNTSGHSRHGVSGDGVVQNLLRSLGYRAFGIFGYDYMFRGLGPQYDYNVPQTVMPFYRLLFSGILMGEFRFDIGLESISHQEYVRAKREVFANPGESPLFVYTHSSIPDHSQNSGACLPDETERYAERLREANTEMRQDVAAITASDPEAIIIIAGDHGPYLTKNCTFTYTAYDRSQITRADIQDRFSVFLAVRWPDGADQPYDEITILQDVFPAVFAWMYDDAGLLRSKIAPDTVDSYAVSGAAVRNGIISGGVDDGQPLFLSGE